MAILFLGMAFWIGGQAAWAGTAVYSNPVLGYRVSYPDDMRLDQSLGNMCTVFRNGECQIEIYYQPLRHKAKQLSQLCELLQQRFPTKQSRPSKLLDRQADRKRP